MQITIQSFHRSQIERKKADSFRRLIIQFHDILLPYVPVTMPKSCLQNQAYLKIDFVRICSKMEIELEFTYMYILLFTAKNCKDL